jgi:TetR/AcrR family transcriptional repressor of nem operon
MARPKEFDEEEVLSKIMLLFWEKGFHGTSLQDLVRTSGLKKGSLYASFGNKEAMFRLALRHYIGSGPFRDPHPHDPIETLVRLYRSFIEEVGVPKKAKRGCMVFNSGIELGSQGTRLSNFVLGEVLRVESLFGELISEAQDAGLIPPHMDTHKATQRAFAAAFTIREMGRFKPDKEFLTDVANMALASLGSERRL